MWIATAVTTFQHHSAPKGKAKPPHCYIHWKFFLGSWEWESLDFRCRFEFHSQEEAAGVLRLKEKKKCFQYRARSQNIKPPPATLCLDAVWSVFTQAILVTWISVDLGFLLTYRHLKNKSPLVRLAPSQHIFQQ